MHTEVCEAVRWKCGMQESSLELQLLFAVSHASV
jgi:hypothetical protein